jgi:ketosteroid isomerase-like protein
MLDDDREAVAAILRAITAAWRDGRADDLVPLFHERMVIAGSECEIHASGRAACVESYREFAANAAVTAYDESAPAIHVWGDTAVASYAWTMTWRRDGAPSAEAGTDQFVLGREQERWQVLHRLLLFAPASGAGG